MRRTYRNCDDSKYREKHHHRVVWFSTVDYTGRRLGKRQPKVEYPLGALLNKLIPWWFTEKYQVAIIDDNDLQYATQTHIAGNPSQSYQIHSRFPKQRFFASIRKGIRAAPAAVPIPESPFKTESPSKRQA
ncbi:MAG: hypothetical protein LBE81_05250 [Azonexus sp.]|jgi:hypothetical protein|uniref:hypothetical protein n=1 Tax=Azonexus sp. TaxID=1872668 RepID=UPI0028223F7A|nr:hypothetical protein [Azonexus sp.]MDR0776027.1 hypothetical protein [Azonexus sp.]